MISCRESVSGLVSSSSCFACPFLHHKGLVSLRIMVLVAVGFGLNCF